MEKELLGRWISMLWGLKVNPAEYLGTYYELVERYSKQDRSYHDLGHVAHCLREFESARHLAQSQLDVEIALWFHDAVYDPKAKDNEEKSAELADAFAKSVAPDAVQNVHRLVIATKHVDVPASIDQQLIADVDLSIFGQPWEVFAKYNAAIREEYSWVEPELFFKERAKVLISFLARPQIYATEFFRAKYEQIARDNLLEAVRKSTASVYLIEEDVLPSVMADSDSEKRVPVGFVHCKLDAEEFCDKGRPDQYRFTEIHQLG